MLTLGLLCLIASSIRAQLTPGLRGPPHQCAAEPSSGLRPPRHGQNNKRRTGGSWGILSPSSPYCSMTEATMMVVALHSVSGLPPNNKDLLDAIASFVFICG